MPNETFHRRSAGLSPRMFMTAGLWVGLAAGCWREVELGPCNDGTADKDLGEECDDGRDNQDPATAPPGACTWECKVQPGCGDMRVDEGAGEECEVGLEGSGRCTKDCRRTRVCGDEFADKDIGEECDSGKANQATQNATPGTCTKECKKARCGNNSVEHGEECDNGDNKNKAADKAEHDDCTMQCKHPQCGDGTRNAGEECDDGNADLNDACPSGPKGTCKKAVCGDGWTQVDSEECDDGNDNEVDSCRKCKADKFVFLTKEAWMGGELGGLTGADEKCQEEAIRYGLKGRYMAWLSDSTGSPASRFNSAEFTGRYILPSDGGGVVAVGWTELTSGMITTPILVHADGNEDKMMNTVNVWTSTQADGQLDASAPRCNDWGTGDGDLSFAVVGEAAAMVVDSRWTLSDPAECDSFNHLYCFGVSPIGVP